MFQVSRSDVLNNTVWTTSSSDKVEYFEAWKFSDTHRPTEHNNRHGFLNDSEIEEWLFQSGVHAPPKPTSPVTTLEGGFRLIVCERVAYRPLSFSMSKESFLKVEERFHLPPATLLSFSLDTGGFSRYMTYDSANSSKVKRIGIVIKAAQKYQVGNYGLSLSHKFSTGLTTALLYGTGAMPGGVDYIKWQACQSAQIFDLIKSAPTLWAHPLFLPTILLHHSIRRAELLCTVDLDDKLVGVQSRLSVSRAGRLSGNGPVEDVMGQKPIGQTRLNLHQLIADMSTNMADIIYFTRLSEWQRDCVEFLNRTLDEVSGFLSSSTIQATRDIRESIDYLISTARRLTIFNSKLKDIMESDFSVLYSFIAQTDNRLNEKMTRLNAKMTASNSRDSTAMKTLAFITTLFLPGTFIATMFSMDMFDWRSSISDSSNNRIVSSYFWIYWAVTIPLTIVVALGWRLWWSWEQHSLDRDVLAELENIDQPMLPEAPPKKDSSEAGSVRLRPAFGRFHSFREGSFY